MNPSSALPLSAAPGAPSRVALVPWWRVGVMWLVVGGLAVVVIASFALLATALRHADTVLPQAVARVATPHNPGAPALQALNHSATPAP